MEHVDFFGSVLEHSYKKQLQEQQWSADGVLSGHKAFHSLDVCLFLSFFDHGLVGLFLPL